MKPSHLPTGRWLSGLAIARGGAGPIVTLTSDADAARLRTERLMAYFDRPGAGMMERAGVRLLFSYVLDTVVLCRCHLVQIAQERCTQVYRDRDCARLEVTDKGEWRTRWRIAPRTVALIDQNRGIAISTKDRQRASRIYRQLVPESRGIDPWRAMLDDAATWWFPRLLRDDFDHYLRLRPSQALPRSALARRATGMVLSAPPTPSEEAGSPVVDFMPAPSASAHPDDEAQLEALRTELRRIVQDKPPRDVGRKRMVRTIELLMAQMKGANAFDVLGALRQMLRKGGVRGTLLAPRTIMNMMDAGLLPLVRRMGDEFALNRNSDAWYREYADLLADPKVSSPSHLRSFLTLFHDYMTVEGAEPLLRGLPGSGPQSPPDARVVLQEELRAALEYVDAVAPTERIRLQARFMLVFGFKVPLRPHEYWCIRMSDVKPDECLTVSIYPRVEDGSGKSPGARRPIDIDEQVVAKAVLDLYHQRQGDGHPGENELLMGDRRAEDGRHRAEHTQRLVTSALRWATGLRDAGLYDLRHTAISAEARRLRPRVDGALSSSDRVTHAELRGFAGHATQKSTDGYVHVDEDDIVPFFERARPLAWVTSDADEAALLRLEPVENNLVKARDPLPAQTMRGQLEVRDLFPSRRLCILRDVIAGYPIETLARLEDTRTDVVAAVIRASVDLAVENHWLRNRHRPRSMPEYCGVLERLRSFDLAAQEAKWKAVALALEDLATKERWHRLLVICNAWRDCIRGRYLAMRTVAGAARLVAFLLQDCHVPRHQMAFQVVRSQAEVPPILDQYQIAERPAKPRRGRPAVRLVVGPPASVASKAGDRVLSAIGLHWLMSAALHTVDAQEAPP